MAPKKKGKKVKGSTLIDGVDTSSMSREQLEAFAHRLKAEMEREREERNFFQMERDKLRNFWEITRNQLEEAEETIRNKDREVEVAQELAEIDIKHVVQQMKHLQYENQSKMGELRAEGLTQLKIAQEDHALQEQQLLRDKQELRRQLMQKEEETELQLQQLQMQHSKLLSKERQLFKDESQEILTAHEHKLNRYIEESEVRHEMEMFEIEERKNHHVTELVEGHEKAFAEIKNYYNDITQNNLALINSLKEHMEELRKRSEKSDGAASEIKSEYMKLSELLKEAQAELAVFRKKLKHYDQDKAELTRIKGKYVNAVKKLEKQKWEIEALQMRVDSLLEDCDAEKERFENAVLDLHKKNSMNNILLERKLSILRLQAEKREAVLGEALAVAGMGPQQFSVRIENVVQEKNDHIQELKYKLAQARKSYDELLATYEAQLTKFGIPKEDLGPKPSRRYKAYQCEKDPARSVVVD